MINETVTFRHTLHSQHKAVNSDEGGGGGTNKRDKWHTLHSQHKTVNSEGGGGATYGTQNQSQSYS